MIKWHVFPKQAGNDCKACGGTGKIQFMSLDGGPYYHWMKPTVEECKECKENRNETHLLPLWL